MDTKYMLKVTNIYVTTVALSCFVSNKETVGNIAKRRACFLFAKATGHTTNYRKSRARCPGGYDAGVALTAKMGVRSTSASVSGHSLLHEGHLAVSSFSLSTRRIIVAAHDVWNGFLQSLHW
jgi:hypothetical protein